MKWNGVRADEINKLNLVLLTNINFMISNLIQVLTYFTLNI